MSSVEGTTALYVPTGLESYVMLRSSPPNDAIPIAVAETAAVARAVLQEAKVKNERWTVADVPDTLGFTVKRKDGRLVARFYVVEVPKWER
jgi:hypothetical protein